MKTDGPPNKKNRFICYLPVPEISKTFGTLLVCGMGDTGQLGLGEDEIEKKKPTLIPSIQELKIVDICAGGMHSLCLTVDGEIYSFGCNDEGALGRDTSEEGSDFIPKKIELPGKAVKISAGDSHSACLLEDGRAFAWGSFRDSHGNMGLTLEGNKRLPVEVLPKVKCCSISSGADHLVVLSSVGKVYTVGCAEQGQLGRVSLRSAGGESRSGKTQLLCPDVVTLKKARHVDAIWATTYCTFVRKMGTDEIHAFGLNNYSQLGIKKKNLNNGPVMVPIFTEFKNVKQIAGGQHHTILLTNENKCFAIGRKDYGRLGLGNVENDLTELVEIDSLNGKGVIEIACGDTQSFAVSNKGILYSWGMGSNQQLGTGTEDDVNEPTMIISKQTQDKCVFKVSSGGQHTLILIKKVKEKSLKAGETLLKAGEKSRNTENLVKKVESPTKGNGNKNDDNKANEDNQLKEKEKSFKAGEKSRNTENPVIKVESPTKVNGNKPDDIKANEATVSKKGRKRKN